MNHRRVPPFLFAFSTRSDPLCVVWMGRMTRLSRVRPGPLGKHAIVIGSSMAGLLTARVLADYFEQVTVLERDVFPASGEARKGVPQGRHAHGLLSAGYRVIQRLFPGIEQDFLSVGAILIDATKDAFWFQNGGYLAPSASDLKGVCLSRPQLEAVVRARVLHLHNVTIDAGVTVLGLTCSERRSVGASRWTVGRALKF
ncbi:hypothetical protein MF271_23055 (plasmid) [Deinococcus sp. KNUC1210]|uniref:FAD-dependent oxidoreductase n=1 Tax=Deinococcus sp. KNUC1210 TaxID=2917691 RepID=UPI001EF00CE7|nr:hypothetical protein [Deinococcus sp. KNUC1210]ULH18340.1 hypothetical protein MF271_23055 [Deinococcus sp. KNUC1210]